MGKSTPIWKCTHCSEINSKHEFCSCWKSLMGGILHRHLCICLYFYAQFHCLEVFFVSCAQTHTYPSFFFLTCFFFPCHLLIAFPLLLWLRWLVWLYYSCVCGKPSQREKASDRWLKCAKAQRTLENITDTRLLWLCMPVCAVSTSSAHKRPVCAHRLHLLISEVPSCSLTLSIGAVAILLSAFEMGRD